MCISHFLTPCLPGHRDRFLRAKKPCDRPHVIDCPILASFLRRMDTKPMGRSLSDTSDGYAFDLKSVAGKLASKKAGAFGAQWSTDFKGQTMKLPSIKEIVDGLVKY